MCHTWKDRKYEVIENKARNFSAIYCCRHHLYSSVSFRSDLLVDYVNKRKLIKLFDSLNSVNFKAIRGSNRFTFNNPKLSSVSTSDRALKYSMNFCFTTLTSVAESEHHQINSIVYSRFVFL
jgi:hypothetical protein